jgi:predicted dehydrogenase
MLTGHTHLVCMTDSGPDDSIRLAIVGLGAMGSEMLDVAVGHPEFAVVRAADISRAAVDDARTRHPDLFFSLEPEQVVIDAQVDAVYIATPPDTHAELAIRALRAGKAVFCEKPLAISLDDSERMLAAASESGLATAVNFALSDRHAVLYLEDALTTGDAGTVTGVDVRLSFPRWPRDFQGAATWLGVQPGDTVLIHAGAGGAGLLLTQVARQLGARVITTVSTPQKAELSRQAGAAVVAGYNDFESVVLRETDGCGVAAVYDSVGLSTFEGSLRSLARRGSLVLFGQSSGRVPPFDISRLAEMGSLTVTRPTLRDFVATSDELRQCPRDLFAWTQAGEVTVHIGGIYRLDDAASAHADLEARRTSGKLLLLP